MWYNKFGIIFSVDERTKPKKMKNKIRGRTSIIINASADKVWEALTTPEIIKEYFFWNRCGF